MDDEELITKIKHLYKKTIFLAEQIENDKSLRKSSLTNFLYDLKLKNLETNKVLDISSIRKFSVYELEDTLEGSTGIVNDSSNTLSLYFDVKERELSKKSNKELKDEIKTLKNTIDDYWMITANTDIIENEFITIPDNVFLNIYHQNVESRKSVHKMIEFKPGDILKNINLSFSGLSHKYYNQEKYCFMGIEQINFTTMKRLQNPYIPFNLGDTLPISHEQTLQEYKGRLAIYKLTAETEIISDNFYHLRNIMSKKFNISGVSSSSSPQEKVLKLLKLNNLIVQVSRFDWNIHRYELFNYGIPHYLRYHNHDLFDINMKLDVNIDNLIYKIKEPSSIDEMVKEINILKDYKKSGRSDIFNSRLRMKNNVIFENIYPARLNLHNVIYKLSKTQSENKIIINLVTDGLHLQKLIDIPQFLDNYPLIKSVKDDSQEFNKSIIQEVESNSDKTIRDTLNYLNSINTVSGANLFTITYLEKTNSIVVFFGDFHTNTIRRNFAQDKYQGLCSNYEGNPNVNSNPKLKEIENYDSNVAHTFVIDIFKYLLNNSDNIKLFIELDILYSGKSIQTRRHKTPLLNEFNSIMNLMNYCRSHKNIYKDRLQLYVDERLLYENMGNQLDDLCKHFYNYTDFRIISQSIKNAQIKSNDLILFTHYMAYYLSSVIPEKNDYEVLKYVELLESEGGYNDYIDKIYESMKKNMCICNEIINHDKMDLLKQKLSEMTEDELYSMFDIYHEKEVNLQEITGASTEDIQGKIEDLRSSMLTKFNEKLINIIQFKNKKELLEYYIFYNIIRPVQNFSLEEDSHPDDYTFNIYNLYMKHPLLKEIDWKFFLLDTEKGAYIKKKIGDKIFSPFKDSFNYQLFLTTIFSFGIHPVFMKKLENLSKDEFFFWLQSNKVDNSIIDILKTTGDHLGENFSEMEVKDIVHFRNVETNSKSKQQDFDDAGLLDIYEIIENRLEDEKKNQFYSQYPYKPPDNSPILRDEEYVFNPNSIFPDNFDKLNRTEVNNFFIIYVKNFLIKKILIQSPEDEYEFFMKRGNDWVKINHLGYNRLMFYEFIVKDFIDFLNKITSKTLLTIKTSNQLRKIYGLYDKLEN